MPEGFFSGVSPSATSLASCRAAQFLTWYNGRMSGNRAHEELQDSLRSAFDSDPEQFESVDDAMDYLAECLRDSVRGLGQPIEDTCEDIRAGHNKPDSG